MQRIAIGGLGLALAATLALTVACGGGMSSRDVPGDVSGDLAGDTSGLDIPAQGDADTGGRDPGPLDTPASDTGDSDTVAPTDLPVVDTFVPHPKADTIPLFDEATVVDFALTFAPDQWTQFQAYRTAKSKEYVHCTFTYNGEVFADAACRSKANATYWGEEKKPQFVVRFNHWDKNGRFRKLRALNLEANPYHSAPIRDRVGMWMFRQVGLDASRVNHVRLTVDGAPYGVYMNIEVVDHEFLEAHFPDPSGNLFDNASELTTNETTSDGSDLSNFDDMVDAEPIDGDHTAFFAAVAKIADVSEILREMAAEATFPTGDNFTNGGTNYLWYDHPNRGFIVIPWDVDDILSEWGDPTSDPFTYSGQPELALPPSKLRQLMYLNPAWKAEYVQHLKAFSEQWLPQVQAKIAEVCTQIRPFVLVDPYAASPDISDFDADCQDAANRADQRRVFLLTALP